jgi:TonB family protein
MIMRLLEVALALLSLNVACWAQSDSAPAQKPVTYTLEPITVSNAVYPVAAREKKIQGLIVETIIVTETGDAEIASVPKVDPILAQAIEDAVKKWKFKPVIVDGKAVPVISKITFNFVLDNESQATNGVVAAIAPANAFPQIVKGSKSIADGVQVYLLKSTKPKYPRAAKKAHIEGTVILGAMIGKDGIPYNLRVVSGNPDLAQAAIDAVKQWRYKPVLFLGRPVDAATTVEVNFRLKE